MTADDSMYLINHPALSLWKWKELFNFELSEDCFNPAWKPSGSNKILEIERTQQSSLSWSIKAFREKSLGLATLIPHTGTRANWTVWLSGLHIYWLILYPSSWIINLLLDGLVSSIVGYFHLSLVFWLALLYSVTRKNIPRCYTLNRPITSQRFLQ